MVIKQLESISIRIDRVVYNTNTCIFIYVYVYVCEVLVIARGRWECVVIKQLEKSGSDLSELIIIHIQGVFSYASSSRLYPCQSMMFIVQFMGVRYSL